MTMLTRLCALVPRRARCRRQLFALPLLSLCVACGVPPGPPAAGAPTHTPRTAVLSPDTLPTHEEEPATALGASPTRAPTLTAVPVATPAPSPTATTVATGSPTPTPSAALPPAAAVIGQDLQVGEVVY